MRAENGAQPHDMPLASTHRVSVAWLHEQYMREDCSFLYVASADMAADMFTKSICHPLKWSSARQHVNVYDGLVELESAVRRSRGLQDKDLGVADV